MEKGSLARSVIDRYCVVVMGGIAAEAERNQQAEGGRSDEAALINLLSSLDGGRTWDIARIQSQARWAASQALLLLREHRAAFDALCAALEAGASVGECILAIEGALDGDELPTAARRRRALAGPRPPPRNPPHRRRRPPRAPRRGSRDRPATPGDLARAAPVSFGFCVRILCDNAHPTEAAWIRTGAARHVSKLYAAKNGASRVQNVPVATASRTNLTPSDARSSR